MLGAPQISQLFALFLAAAPVPPAATCTSPAEQALAAGAPLELLVGYADAPPLVWNAEGRPQQPVGMGVDLLQLLAKNNGWKLRFHPFSVDDVVANVAACKLDVGIVNGVPPKLWQRESAALDLTVPYYETVAVVARRAGPAPVAEGEEPPAPPGRLEVWLAGGVRALFFGGLALALLVALVAVANLRMPRAPGRFWPERLRLVALDPGVAGAAGALRWLRSGAGRVLALLWVLGGVAVSLASAPPAGAGSGSESRAALVAALRQTIDELDAVGVRPGGRVIECPDIVRCLQDLTRGDLAAVAAGSGTICHYVRAESLDGVRFEPDLLWPRSHAFLVPPSGPLRRTLNAAMGKAAAENAETLAAIRASYGVPWKPPALSLTCPPGRETHR